MLPSTKSMNFRKYIIFLLTKCLRGPDEMA